MKCVAYMRVSTEKQAEEGYGLDSQKRDILNYCNEKGLIISEWYVDDGYSGENLDRPEIQRLITDCRQKRVNQVVSYALDRVARSTLDTIYVLERVFLKNNVSLHCVHNTVNYSTPSEQFQTQIIAAVAEYERKNIILRMRGGMLERVKQGYWMGGGNLPYCYSYDDDKGILVPIPEKKDHARHAMDLFLSGMSDVKIAKIIGVREGTIRSILTSPVNAGKIPYKGNIYQGLHEPIFTETEYYLLQESRKIRSERKMYSHTDNNLLTGLCYCGICGCKMRYQKWNNGEHKIYCMSRNSSMDYLPNHNKDCDNSLEWANDIEEQVKDAISKISIELSNPAEKKSKSEIIKKSISKEESRLSRLYDLYADGNDLVLDTIKKTESRIKELKNELKTETDNLKNIEETKKISENIKNLADVWGKVDKVKTNKVLRSIISKIIIVNGNIDIVLVNY